MAKQVNVIESTSDNYTLVWKHPCENFNTLSQLIVHESQEAILYVNGKALDLFKPGEHTLHTKNIPLLSKLLNLPTNGVSAFTCEVYFINKTEQMAIPWGFGDVNYPDPKHNDYVFSIGASGEMSIRVGDSRKLITKLVGTEAGLDQDTIRRYFKTPLVAHAKSLLPAILRDKGLSIFEVESDLIQLSAQLKESLAEEMDDYGVILEKFWIKNVLRPEDDPFYMTLNRQRGEKVTIANQGELDIQRADYKRQVDVIDHSGEVQKQRMDIDTRRYELEQLGISKQQERAFDVMEKIAQNEGSGSDLRNAAMGVGMGFGVGGAFGNAITSIANSTMMTSLTDAVAVPPVGTVPGNPPQTIELKEEASATASPSDDLDVFKKKIEKLTVMKEAGLITDEEFEKKKQSFLDEI